MGNKTIFEHQKQFLRRGKVYLNTADEMHATPETNLVRKQNEKVVEINLVRFASAI